jgi:hypothetical protein
MEQAASDPRGFHGVCRDAPIDLRGRGYPRLLHAITDKSTTRWRSITRSNRDQSIAAFTAR